MRIPKDTIKAVAKIDIQTTENFDAWLAQLKDRRAVTRIQARIDRAESGNLGDCISEVRIHHGPGYRLHFVQRGMTLVILLAGGDKSTQGRDIKLAQSLAQQL